MILQSKFYGSFEEIDAIRFLACFFLPWLGVVSFPLRLTFDDWSTKMPKMVGDNDNDDWALGWYLYRFSSAINGTNFMTQYRRICGDDHWKRPSQRLWPLSEASRKELFPMIPSHTRRSVEKNKLATTSFVTWLVEVSALLVDINDKECTDFF